MSPPPTVNELKQALADVREAVKLEHRGIIGEELLLFDLVDKLPAHCFFSHANLEGELVVSRALVEKAYEVLNAGPGSAGILRALLLLKEALA